MWRRSSSDSTWARIPTRSSTPGEECDYDLFQIFYIDAARPRFSTPLHDAVCCGRQEVVRLLLERGAEVNEVDYKLSTPLRLALRWVVSR